VREVILGDLADETETAVTCPRALSGNMEGRMTRAPMAVSFAACIGVWLGVVGCAGSAPKTPAASATATAPPPPTPSGSTTAPGVGLAIAPESAGSGAVAASDATPMGAPAAASSTEPAAGAGLSPLPVPETPPPALATAPRVLVADELPYSPAHLRAHDSKVEHAERHHPRDRESESAGARGSSRGAEALLDHDPPSRRPYHPAPGIVVDVVAAEGGESASDLQRAARNLGYWPFRQCYEDGLRRDPRLAGKVSLELAIGPGGAVDRSVVTATTVRDEIVAACVAREAQHLALPVAASPTTAKVDVSLALGDEPVPMGRSVPNAAPIREALRASWAGVRRCYANELASHPGIGGRMELHFHVRRGEIVQVDEVGDSGGRFADVEVTRCVLGIYRTTRLPLASHGTRERSFVYALQLESMPVDAAAP
jgi:hypothetical protein